MVFQCNICIEFQCDSFAILLNHIGRVHGSDPNFSILCGIDSCSRTYSNYRALRNHINAQHRHLLQGNDTTFETVFAPNYATNQDSDSSSSSSDSDDENDMLERQMRKANAFWLLKMKQEGQTSQHCVNEIVTSTTEIVRNSVNTVKSQVVQALQQSGIDYKNIQGMEEIFKESHPSMNPFAGIATTVSQTKFYKINFGLVEPVRITLGHKHRRRRKKLKTLQIREADQAVYIPLLSSLQQLLNDDSVLEEIDNPHQRQDGLISDFCDGEVFRNHPLFSRDPKALQLILYFDEFEVCNPLGTKTTIHKLGAFYFTLGNIRAKNRSHLNSIFLLALVKSDLLKEYGVEAVLEPFMADLSKLEQNAGHEFLIKGEERAFRGSIAFLSADNLGAQYIGGLKSGLAYRRCRECMATAQMIIEFFHERYVALRTKDGYNNQCHLIATNDYYKKVYGINRYCSLNNSEYYHIIGGLPADAMHDILEGVLQYEVKELLKELIYSQNFFTFNELIRRMASFDYGYYNDSNKPSALTEAKLLSSDHSVKQKANQMWCLGLYLPLIVGSLVPDDNEHWLLFCKFLQIMSILFAPTVHENQIAHVQVLIEEHGQKFKELYDDCTITPKMHYMIHLPRTILRLGPLVRSWCMRFEAKHHYFKKLAMSIGNFKNIALSLARRHQEWLCYQLQTPPGHMTTFISKGVEFGPGKQIFAGDVGYFQALQREIPTVTRQTCITECRWVTLLGTLYKQDCILCLGLAAGDTEFGILKKICVAPGIDIRFIVSKIATVGWNDHFQSHEVGDEFNPPTLIIIKQSDLVDYYLPLHTIKLANIPHSKFIVTKHDIPEN